MANVIMNRVKDKQFPDSIRDVIFYPNAFEPTRNGSFDKAKPEEMQYKAVETATQVDYSRGALYFRSIKGATPDCWHERSLTPLFDHGGHRFYK